MADETLDEDTHELTLVRRVVAKADFDRLGVRGKLYLERREFGRGTRRERAAENVDVFVHCLLQTLVIVVLETFAFRRPDHRLHAGFDLFVLIRVDGI